LIFIKDPGLPRAGRDLFIFVHLRKIEKRQEFQVKTAAVLSGRVYRFKETIALLFLI